MKTLLHICELDDGKLEFYGADYSEFERHHSSLNRYIHQLRMAPWAAKFWISLFGAAQQFQDLEMSFLSREPEFDNYYEEEEYLPDWDDSSWPTSKMEVFPKPKSNPEADPEWQKKKMAVSTSLTEWRQEMAARKGIHDWEVIKHSVLAEIARKMPLSQKELMDVRGVGITTWDRYGEDVLTVVQRALDSLEEPDSVAGDDESSCAVVEDGGSAGAGPLEEPCPAPA